METYFVKYLLYTTKSGYKTSQIPQMKPIDIHKLLSNKKTFISEFDSSRIGAVHEKFDPRRILMCLRVNFTSTTECKLCLIRFITYVM